MTALNELGIASAGHQTIIANGNPDEIRTHPDVIRIYLGDDADD